MRKPMYKLVRKIKGTTRWGVCSLHVDSKVIKGAMTADKSVVEANKVAIEKMYPKEVYAILEV